jgi:hypothetical protein
MLKFCKMMLKYTKTRMSETMKYLFYILIFLNSSLIQAMDGKRDREGATAGNPIVIESLDDADTSPLSTSPKSSAEKKKKVTFSPIKKEEPLKKEDPKVVVPIITSPARVIQKPKGFRDGFQRIETPVFILERICSSQAYFELIDVIFTDAEKRGIKKIFGLTREDAITNVKRMELSQDFAQDTHFGDYQIRNPQNNNNIFGALFFCHAQVSAAKMNYGQEGLVETHFHLISTFQGNGTGYEVLKKAIDTFVRPNDLLMALPGVTIPYMKIPGEHQASQLNRCAFKGLLHKVSLLGSNALESHAHANSYYAAGFGAKLWNDELVMSFPHECYLPGSPLKRGEFEIVLKIIQKMRSCRDYKMEKLTPKPKGLDNFPFEEVAIDLQEILTNQLYGTSQAILKQHYLNLLVVEEPFTFVTAFNMLFTHFKTELTQLKDHVSAEKTEDVIKFFRNNKVIPSPVKLGPLWELSSEHKKPSHK